MGIFLSGAMEEQKNKRTPNFSESERQLLLKLTNKFKSIIENKKTDAITWREKEECWRKIELQYNASTSGPPRNSKQLKNKYEAIKKELKKKHSQYKCYLNGTGGGKFVPPPTPSTEDEKALSETIAISIECLQSQYDSDGTAGVCGKSLDTLETSVGGEKEIETITVNWESPSSKLWQTAKHPLLKERERKVSNGIAVLSGDETSQENCNSSDGHRPSSSTTPLQKNGNTATIESLDVTEDAIGDISVENTQVSLENVTEDAIGDISVENTQVSVEGTKQIKKKNWQIWRTPVLPKKRCASSVASKFEQVADRKLEVLELQKNAILAKMGQDKEAHERNMELIELRREKERLQIQYLKEGNCTFEI